MNNNSDNSLLSPDKNRYVRPNDSWQCDLDESQPCGGTGSHLTKEGSCTPKPSLRLQRGIFTASCTAMIVGLLIACWNSPKRNEFLAPGPLTSSHAQILVAEGTDRCASCHGAGDSTLANWVRDAVSMGTHIPISQSQLCMECHEQSLQAEFALHAHNLPPKKLAALTVSVTPTHSSVGFPDPRNGAGQLACATCHREHHGADFNLAALTDNQCQTCHVNHFHSFEQDHPEFTSWPFPHRTGIAFDHVSHSTRHFVDKNETFNCQQCHVDDQDGNVKLVESFDMSCAKCHEADVTGDQNPAWTLFQMPMLDVEALAAAGYSIGLWPSDCQGDFDGQIPPAMKFLLMSDARTAAIFRRHGNSFEFSDLDPDNESDLSDAASLAWSIKELLFGLTINGSQEIRERTESNLGTKIDTGRLRGITFGLHNAVFAQAQQRWVPQLLSEMAARQKELNGDHRVTVDQIFARPILQEEDATTLAVNPLKKLYQGPKDSKSNVVETSDEKVATVVQNTTQTLEQTEPVAPRIVNVPQQQTSAAPSDSTSRVLNSHITSNQEVGELQFQGRGDVLAVNPLAGLKSGMQIQPPTVPPANPPSPPPVNPIVDPVVNNQPVDPSGNLPTTTNGTVQISMDDAYRAITKMANASNGGWYRDDSAFKISYRVSEHIDPLLKSWTDLAISNRTNMAIQDSALFESLNSSIAPGQCRSCHTADQLDDSSLIVNWQPKYRDTSVRGFTRFSHRPHDIQTSLQDCNSCHQLDTTRSNSDSFAGLDAHAFLSNFMPISKSNCANCHRKGGAASGCVDCHNYHIGSKVTGKK